MEENFFISEGDGKRLAATLDTDGCISISLASRKKKVGHGRMFLLMSTPAKPADS